MGSIALVWNAWVARTRRTGIPASVRRWRSARIWSLGPATTQLPGSFTADSSTSGGRYCVTSSGPRATATMAPGGDSCIRRARSDTVLIAVCRSNTPARVAAMYSPVLYPMYAPARTPKVSTNFASAYSTVNNAGCERSMRSRSVAVPSNTSACKSMPVSSRNPAAQVSKCWAKTGSVS
ncbi:Uncharacterised protein [Mycobacterium tuberculosis]|uniref:Uncharacterized protein n=3 Tax=Mycobacterium tuberculosis TaxID=1773 RepID=A0A655JJA6_MYCTX|nr:Uncharacterised protein [Mycobacterium tuberculosis]COV98578.1 Uncharacterised protein [Mycobacterium tuberculosis]COW39146.1 Uncharacterised protein [Mycobacterium tuberculosis]COW97062.1 Uncharacterised protein [Mycobacterium tuberculosis]COX02058.1 Uncharacterised protein [Mycobacterium tuberculosis]